MEAKADEAILLSDDINTDRKLIIEILTNAVIRQLTQSTDQKSEEKLARLQDSGLSSSQNDRSL